MTMLQPPPLKDLPTIRQLNRATLIATVAGAMILVTTVLPAEWGIDPTGVGRVLGLTAMGQTKLAAADQAADDRPLTTVLADGSHQVRLVLRPQQGKEVKATMAADQEFTYRWATDGAPVSFELHGNPEGAAEEDYMSYEKGTSADASGIFRAPFDGRHGWYWKNAGDKPVTLTVTVKGSFAAFGAMD